MEGPLKISFIAEGWPSLNIWNQNQNEELQCKLNFESVMKITFLSYELVSIQRKTFAKSDISRTTLVGNETCWHWEGCPCPATIVVPVTTPFGCHTHCIARKCPLNTLIGNALFITLKLWRAMERNKKQWYKITKNYILQEIPVQLFLFEFGRIRNSILERTEGIFPPSLMPSCIPSALCYMNSRAKVSLGGGCI